MSVGTADIRTALMPSNDGAVARAFRDLEEKLKAWSVAAAALNEHFANYAAVPPQSVAATAKVESQQSAERPISDEAAKQKAATRLRESEPAPQPIVQEKQVAPKAAIPPVVEKIEKAAVPAPVAETASTVPAQEVVDDETLLAGLNPERAEAIRARHAFFKGRKSIGELIQEFEDEADDEESLLMSLDPEFAKAVRVKYRLYNGRKTLREVIAEVEASQPRQSQSDKKSWWRR